MNYQHKYFDDNNNEDTDKKDLGLSNILSELAFSIDKMVQKSAKRELKDDVVNDV